jgi:hypothetical protein
MRLTLLLAVALATSCSSKKNDETATNDSPPAATERATAAENSCRDRGDAAACLVAARASQRQELANELYELACIHGEAAGCVAQAEQQRTPVSWYGMACRRGAADACSKADPWAAWVAQRIEVAKTSPGAVGDRLRNVYVQTVADCLAQAPAAERDAAGRIAIELALEGGAPTSVRVSSDARATASCIESAGRRWRFAADSGAGPHMIELTVKPAATAGDAGAEPPRARGPLAAEVRYTARPRNAAAGWWTVADKKIRKMYLSGLKLCYRAALVRTPGLAGTVEVTVTIDRTGRATAKVGDTGDPELATCLAKKVQSRWKFQPPVDGKGAQIDAEVGMNLVFTRG